VQRQGDGYVKGVATAVYCLTVVLIHFELNREDILWLAEK